MRSSTYHLELGCRLTPGALVTLVETKLPTISKARSMFFRGANPPCAVLHTSLLLSFSPPQQLLILQLLHCMLLKVMVQWSESHLIAAKIKKATLPSLSSFMPALALECTHKSTFSTFIHVVWLEQPFSTCVP